MVRLAIDVVVVFSCLDLLYAVVGKGKLVLFPEVVTWMAGIVGVVAAASKCN